MALSKAKIITITSVKGGTGKSTIVVNMAGILSKKNKKTIILDLDLSSGVIAPILNVNASKDIFTLSDDMMNNRFEGIDNYIKSYNENIDVLPAPIDPRNALKIPYQFITNIIKQLEYKYDIILIDTSHVINNIVLPVLDLSTEIIYVITDDLMDLKNMKTMISIYQNMNKENYKIVLNKSSQKYLSNFEIKTILDRDVSYVLPESFFIEDIQDYILQGKIYALDKPKNKGIIALSNLIDEIIKED